MSEWIFTFGVGHVHPQTGEDLINRYVVIEGDYASARAEMVRRFGRRWCGQYASAQDAGVEAYNLVELVDEHPPPRAA